MVCRAEAPQALVARPHSSAHLRLRSVRLRSDDVQPAASRRHYRPRNWGDHCRHRARSVWRDSGYLDRTCDSGIILRRWRSHHTGRELLQHGDCGLAGRLCKLPADCRGCEHRLETKDRGSRNRRLSRRERRCFRCRNRVRNSALAISRCPRNAAVCTLSLQGRTYRNDDRPPDLRRIGGSRDLCRTRRVLASGGSESAAEHFRNSGQQGIRPSLPHRDKLTATIVACRRSPHAADAPGNPGRGPGVERMVSVRIRPVRITSADCGCNHRPNGWHSRRDAEARESLDRAVSRLCARLREELCLRLSAFGHVWSRLPALALAPGAALRGAAASDEILRMKRGGFIQSTVVGFTRAFARALMSEEIGRQRGLLQSLDPRVRVVGLFALVLAVTLSRRLAVVLVLFVAAVMIAIFSRVSIGTLAKRVWLVVLAFTGVIALPAIFITPGNPIATFAGGSLRITAPGVATAVLLIARVETAVTFTTLLILCTPWTHVLKALRLFHLPHEVIAMLAMTHRYVFLLLETASQMFESRQSRTVGRFPAAVQRHIAARTAGVLLSKSIDLSNDVYLAMQSRGFRGEVRRCRGRCSC